MPAAVYWIELRRCDGSEYLSSLSGHPSGRADIHDGLYRADRRGLCRGAGKKGVGRLPERVELTVSGNIIKNVKSVIVPHTGGRKGLRTAVAVGICCGKSDRALEVVSDVTADGLARMDAFLNSADIVLRESSADCPFDIQVYAQTDGDTSFVRIIGQHTNVVRIEKNGDVLFDKPFSIDAAQIPENRKRSGLFLAYFR